MIINILAEAPIRLYRLASFFRDKPMPLLFPWRAIGKPRSSMMPEPDESWMTSGRPILRKC
ncbi:MAG: DUF4277 domain-containing protein [Ardenticatenaceae bacterium]|nr:DUF4277 domain-containing protein [Ardenticatenaceae bacterium]